MSARFFEEMRRLGPRYWLAIREEEMEEGEPDGFVRTAVLYFGDESVSGISALDEDTADRLTLEMLRAEKKRDA
jgi:hypothetical protein